MNDIGQQISIEALAEEFMERKRRGESPHISEYTAKYPDLADEIEEIFPAMELMEDFKPASGDLSDESATSRPAIPNLRQVADYRILKEIGRGGMGIVYEAEQQSLGRRVALKVLPQSTVGGNTLLDRFQREARAAAKMHHTNIVPVFEVGHDDQCAFYAMQLIQGQGLDAVIGDLRDLRSAHTGSPNGPKENHLDGRMSLAQSLVTGHFDCAKLDDSSSNEGSDNHPALTETVVAAAGSTVSASLPGDGELSRGEDNRRAYFHSVAEIGHQCAEALSYAHARGIIHRDIKPSNLVLDTNGVVWVTDFGLAKTNDVGLTQTGDILGTIRYMSPERFKGQCDNRADVYSLGLTLYEMLVLKPAYESPDRLKLIDIVTKSEVTAPRSIDTRIPRDLETIVLKACDKDPKRRYQSADDMADDLQRFLNDDPILARRASPTERFARWTRRNPWLATAMSVVAASLIAITGISIVAAQTQSQLNGQLAAANQDQQELNAELRKKSEEQQQTNQALVESNKSKEELIRDLKKSQSRLAEKQAEFVEEKGNLAESMLWLARSYELADGQAPEFRRNLLNKLEASAARMPRLIGVRATGMGGSGPSAVFRDEVRERLLSAASNEDRRAVFEEIRNSRGRAPAAPAMSTDQTLIAYPIVWPMDDDSESPSRIDEIRVWDVATGSWTGKTIRSELPVARVAVHSEKRLIAAFLFEANDEPNSTEVGRLGTSSRPTSNGLFGNIALAVWSIDSGDLLLQHGVANDVPDPRRGLRPLQFRSDGTEIVAVTGTVATAEGVPVTVFSTTSGEVIRENHFRQESSGRFRSQISPDGRRIIIASSPSPFGANRSTEITCYDIDTGEQVGETLETESVRTFGRGNLQPTVLTPDGSRVAAFAGAAGDQRIEILDFETGGQIGDSIDVPRTAGSTIFNLNANSTGTQLAVSTVPSGGVERLRQSTNRVHVHVFDVETGSAVTPPLPVSDRVDFVAMPDAMATLSIGLNGTIQTWQLPQSQLHRVLFPWQGLAMQSSVPPFIRNRGIDFTNRLSTALRIARDTRASVSTLDNSVLTSPSIELAIDQKGHVLAAEKDQSGISLKTWNRQTGRLLATKKLANTESSFVGMFSPGAEYLLTGYVGEGPDATAFVQVWRTTTCTKHGEPFEFTKGGPEDAPLAISPDGVSLLLQRRELRDRFGFRLTPVLVDLPTGEETILPAPANTAEFSADGRFVLLNFPTKQQRYDLKAGTFDPPLDVTDNALASPGVRRGIRGGFGPGTSRTAARSGDGMLTATIVDGSLVQIHRVGFSERIGREEPLLVELTHPSPVLSVTFDPESKLVITASADGLIRQWSLPQQWTGTPEEIRHRVEHHTGLSLGKADQVVVVDGLANLKSTEQNSDDHQTLSGDGPQVVASSATRFLTRDEIDAIRLRHEGRWEEADAALANWASLRPDDWQPHALRMRTLVELRKFDEADSEWNEMTRLIGRDAAYAWLRSDFDARFAYSSDTNSTNDARHNRLDEETAAIQGWYSGRLLELAPDDTTKVALLFSLAKSHEIQFEFEKAAEAINQAVALQNDSADMHYYRAHLMERLNRWDEALVSREQMLRLEPDHHFHQYRLATYHLFHNKAGDFHQLWHSMLDQWKDTDDPRIPGRHAKLGLLANVAGEDLKTSLALADWSFENRSGQLISFDVLAKGMAEYRRGNFEDALKYLHDASVGFEGAGSYRDNVAMCRYFAAMAHHQLDKSDEALMAFFDALDRQHGWRTRLGSSNSATWIDWQQTETVRREAEDLLKIDFDAIEPPVTDTSDWKVFFEEDFNDDISEDWQQLTGEWSVVDGAACGVLASPVYGRLEREFPNLPDTFEIEYDTWTSAPMLAACFLRRSTDEEKLIGHRVALSSTPDRDLVMQNQAATGVSLLTNTGWAERGFWFPGTSPDFKVQPRQHYQVRIIRQPQRITVFVDDKQVLSERVRNIETKSIRFFARGEEGTKMFVDNIRIRVPAK